MDRFWVMIEKKLQGPFEVAELMALKDFQQKMLVCRQGEDAWKPAQDFTVIRQRLMIAIDPASAASSPSISTLPPAPSLGSVKTSGDFISPDFQFEPPKVRPPASKSIPARRSLAPKATAKAPAKTFTGVAKATPLARRKRVMVIAVLSLLVTMGNLVVYASWMGVPMSGLLHPYRNPRQIEGTRFTQAKPHPARLRPAHTPSTHAALWLVHHAQTAAPTRISHRPWFDRTAVSRPSRPHSLPRRSPQHRR